MEMDPTLETYREGKAFVVLYQFHALRFPGMAVHHYKFSQKLKELESLPDDTVYVPEETLTREGLSVIAKEREIRLQFRKVFTKEEMALLFDGPYEYILERCEAARHRFHAEVDLIDEAGLQLSSADILPAPEVVNAMTEDFILHNRRRCEPLEQFISQLSSPAT